MNIESMISEALDALAGQLHDKVLDEVGEPSANDAKLWQRIRDALDSERLSLERAAGAAYDCEYKALAR